MSTRVCICPNCKILMTYSSEAKTCPKCSTVLEGSFTGVAKEYDISVSGSSPYLHDKQKLRSAPFEKLKVSKFEIQRAIKWIVSGIILAPLLMLFGSWVIAHFVGPGVLIFGYGAFIAGPVSFLVCMTTGLGIIVGDPRGKTAKKAFEKIWKDALFDAGAASMASQYSGSKNVGFLYRRFLRSIHPLQRNVTEQEVTAYIEGLRKIARTYFDEIGSSLDLSCINNKGTAFNGHWDNYYQLDSSCEIISEDSEKAVVHGRISIHFDKTCKISDKVTYNLPAAVVNYHVKQEFVKCGDYWTPADPLPEVVNG